uniref:Uncharacterized protein n=1 Tax=Rhodopseudomonas palustris (strain BisA53) TaxID=316055 RepID=Q07VH3_RHOP5
MARFDSNTGKILQSSQITLGDSDGKLSRTGGISIEGTNTNNSGCTGCVGEILTALAGASSVALTSGSSKTCVSLPVTEGDWDIVATVTLNGAALTTIGFMDASVSTATDTRGIPSNTTYFGNSLPFASFSSNIGIAAPAYKLQAGTTATINLVGTFTFGASTLTCGGQIIARRACYVTPRMACHPLDSAT